MRYFYEDTHQEILDPKVVEEMVTSGQASTQIGYIVVGRTAETFAILPGTNYRYRIDPTDIVEECVFVHAFSDYEKLENLKQEIAQYDYIGTKIACGVATREEYAEQIAYTETLREKIRALEDKVNG